ncbi:peptidyl-tRNA hydrolase ICT1, mitochondrial [Cephus cinctus]|uniref:Large ribosomal subunit protein mL62 n=1 Tax=Cephus cinctus TaxID=211228 RepID=A0AAJ7BZ48_CEPCN|nr:peptidyl-tRNA hydrolase ICT1, mitochondrial [Cephus cinctus]
MNFVSRYCLKIFKNEVTNQGHVCGLGRTLSYKSAYALENLYPKSSLKITTPNFVPEDPQAKFDGFVPLEKLDITYSRSSGPGGQNVNTVNTKVDLRLHVANATWLHEDIRSKLIEQNKTKISKEGYLIIKSDLTRSQQLNLADALEKLRTLIRKTLEQKPEISDKTREILRKRQIKVARERVFVKRMRSDIKEQRRGSDIDI